MNRALEKLRAGSGYKGSLYSGQERVCCHLLKAPRLALEELQLSGEEEKRASVSSAKSSSDGPATSGYRRENLWPQRSGSELGLGHSRAVAGTRSPRMCSGTCCRARPGLSSAMDVEATLGPTKAFIRQVSSQLEGA